MNKDKKQKKIDIEARIFMNLLHLKEEENKKYSIEECEKNIAYLLDSYEEFKFYFQINGFPDINEDLLETCRMKTTRKGTIIALKVLCDYVIRKHNLMYIDSLTEERKFDVLAVPCDRTFAVAPEKVEEFKNLKSNPEVKQKIEKMIEKFRVNNLVEEGAVLKKTRKPNKKII